MEKKYHKNNNNKNNYPKSNNKRKNNYKKNKSKKENFQKKSEDSEIRLNRYIASSGVCSRRQADVYIKNGHVSVNGKIVTDYGTKIKKGDVVKFKGRVLKGEKNVYIVMNKPKNYISSLSDPQGRATVIELFKGKVKERIYPVGRLDRNTTGTLLFTNDGDLTTKLTHPKRKITKVYVVTLDKMVTLNDMKMIANGIELEDGFINADAIYYFNNNNKEIKNKVVIEIHSGKNRIVRRIFEHLEYDVKNLDRIEFAGINKKNLKRGQWRFLETKEIGYLKMLAGKK